MGRGNKGIYTCSAFTGAGKTLASLRFALEQAKKFNMEHIFLIAPYTSIIDQNADCIRNILETENEKGKFVFECHSNLSDDKKRTLYDSITEYEDAAETWNAPVIVTTMVQFLETLFASGTKKIRRMHNLVNSVLVFDEIQTLPIKSTYLFNWGLDYLVKCCGCSALLCTATQPALEGTIGSDTKTFEGISENLITDIIDNPQELAEQLKRVEINTDFAKEKMPDWESVRDELCEYEQVLCIVQTRKDCRTLHSLMPEGTIHLSALMCAEERSDVIAKIKDRLRNYQPVRVISTQLVECGVDIDFPVVFRALAGLDSVAQAAGRCNRD